MMRRWALGILCLLLLGGWRPMESLESNSKEGNELYKDSRYDEAVDAYRKSLERYPEHPEILYNLGVSLYQGAQSMGLGKARDVLLLESASLFGRVAVKGPRYLRGRSLYNLGNVRFALRQFEEAVATYQEAMRVGYRKLNIRYNLELALRERQIARSGEALAEKPPEGAPVDGETSMFADTNDVQRKLDALERRSRTLYLEYLRKKVNPWMDRRPKEDW